MLSTGPEPVSLRMSRIKLTHVICTQGCSTSIIRLYKNYIIINSQFNRPFPTVIIRTYVGLTSEKKNHGVSPWRAAATPNSHKEAPLQILERYNLSPCRPRPHTRQPRPHLVPPTSLLHLLVLSPLSGWLVFFKTAKLGKSTGTASHAHFAGGCVLISN
jgi:hypothetical protein